MSHYFGYIRVSTTKQGDGVSLEEQRKAIERYADKHKLELVKWFEEKKTAAKQGRPEFNRMLELLRKGKADGAIIHKIDRSTRNLKDWAKLGDLIDEGVDIHFATESLDLNSRGGRLSADIQAVVASDYIRNLRHEVKKGFYGRLEQGLYPLPAPVGYTDEGGGNPKGIDPVEGPLVRQAFEMYATGEYSLEKLAEEMTERGLTNRKGGPVTTTGLSTMLNNPFYYGIIRIKKTDETFEGVHEPLISKSLFDQVQRILRDKNQKNVQAHRHTYRRLFQCVHCGYSLVGEKQKGYVYYRCHTSDCPTKTVREGAIEEAVLDALAPLRLNDEEERILMAKAQEFRADWKQDRAAEAKAVRLQIEEAKSRLHRLTDAYLDGSIEEELFKERKDALLDRRAELKEDLERLTAEDRSLPDEVSEYLERAKDAWISYKQANGPERRQILKSVTSNREVDGRNVVIELKTPFRIIAERRSNDYGTPCPGGSRTLNGVVVALERILTRD